MSGSRRSDYGAHYIVLLQCCGQRSLLSAPAAPATYCPPHPLIGRIVIPVFSLDMHLVDPAYQFCLQELRCHQPMPLGATFIYRQCLLPAVQPGHRLDECGMTLQ